MMTTIGNDSHANNESKDNKDQQAHYKGICNKINGTRDKRDKRKVAKQRLEDLVRLQLPPPYIRQSAYSVLYDPVDGDVLFAQPL